MTLSPGQLPNVFLIGAPRCGTTALSTALAAHPDVYMPEIKEPHYFLSNDKPFDYSGPGDRAVSRMWTSSFDQYLGLYCTDAQIRIDASTSYFQEEGCVERILDRVPDAKFIVCLRDPVDRAASAFGFFRSMGLETETSLSEAIRREPERLASGHAPGWGYARQSLYAEPLRSLCRLAPPPHCLIVDFDDVVTACDDLKTRIASFLEVADVDLSPTQDHRNGAHAPRNRVEAALLARPSKIRPFVAQHAPPLLVKALKERRASGTTDKATKRLSAAQVAELFEEDALITRSLLNAEERSPSVVPVGSIRPVSHTDSTEACS